MSEALPTPAASPGRRAWHRFCANRLAMASALFLLLLLALVVLFPLLLSHGPNATSDRQFEPPSAGHWCGTDVHGRDLLARILFGARISLLVGAIGTLVSLVIGVIWGAVAGYVGGRTDGIMMRFVDILYALPSIVFVIVLITTLNGFVTKFQAHGLSPGYATAAQFMGLFAGLGAVSWLTMARIVRGQVLSLRTRPFVEASRVLGASHARILFRHIVPNISGLIIVYLTLTIPSIVLYESFLSFLGLGVQPPMASWGSLIADGANQLNPIRIYWWLLVFPGATLVATLVALNYLGDGLRDALEPRSSPGADATP